MNSKDASSRTIRLAEYQPSSFLIDKTRLKVVLGESETRVTTELEIQRNPDSAAPKSNDIVLNAEDMRVLSVAIDGKEVSAYQYGDDRLTLQAVPDQFTLKTEVEIHPEKNTSLMGLYKSRAMFCTQCEAEGFRKITPYLDRPDVMSEFTTTIVADSKRYPVLLSNGNLVSETDLDNGLKEVVWQDPFKKPAYLFALVASDLVHIEDSFTTSSNKEVCIRIYVEEKDLDKCAHAMRSLKAAMKWDEETYGREYDLDIFMIVAVDDFNMGAMENKGLNIFNTSAVLANPKTTTDVRFQWVEAVVAHEYFHNWSGNRVTCRDWFQLSLKEGFTVFRDSEFSADLNSRTVKRIEDVRVLRAHQFAEDAGPLAHPVQPDAYMEINNFYTLTVYEKGSEVVRMQANLLGPELFRKGTDLYFERHDGEAVTIEDFVACMEEVSGQNLTQFKNWYKQAGTPEVKVTNTFDADAGTLTLRFVQSCPPTPEAEIKQPFVIPIKMGLVGEQGDLPLHCSEAELAGESQAVITLTESDQQFVFEGLSEQPALSLLRSFSAPIKLELDQSEVELQRLMQSDSDGFNRWDASQRLGVLAIQNAQEALRLGEAPNLDPTYLDTYKTLLEDVSLDKAMVAQMLSLPSIEELSQLEERIDLDRLYEARSSVRKLVAGALKKEFSRVYMANRSDAPFEPSSEQIAQRSVKNVCLNYWMLTEDTQALRAALTQFGEATNMTDQSSALTAIVNADWEDAGKVCDEVLDEFYKQWQHESLVVNQWFGIQSASTKPGGLARLKSLLKHPAFDIKNPNKARALIGGFCGLNPYNMHNADGSGYEFVADQIIKLNDINPQIASRLAVPLTKWRKMDEDRANLMKKQLERISNHPGLSGDVNELVIKSLR